jgi:glycosyltransferase involved in cell wall biosynthesis
VLEAVTTTKDAGPVTSPVVTVVLPAYNEEALISRSLDRVVAHLRTIEDRYPWEVLVVDDGSTDRTSEIVMEFVSREPRIRVLRHHTNFNLGEALRNAFRNARGDYIVTLDSDMSYAPEHIVQLLDAIVDTRAKIVIASPYIEGGQVSAVPRLRELLSRVANRLLSLTAQGHLTTVTGMVRAYDRRFIESLDLKAWDFEINTEIVYKAQLLRARIVEIPAHLDWSEQQKVRSRRRSSIRIRRAVLAQAFSSFLFRPFLYFVIPGIFVLLLSIYALGWALYHTIDAWLDESVTTLSQAFARAFELSPHAFVIGGIGLLVAIQLISLGIVSAQNKRYFDDLFHLQTSIYRQSLSGRFAPATELLGGEGRSKPLENDSVSEESTQLH